MWKTSLILAIGVVFLWYGIFSYSAQNNEYWDSVGPQWACMLNPAKYDFCEIEE